MRAMLNHYGHDVLLLGYDVPRSIDDLWRGVRAKSILETDFERHLLIGGIGIGGCW